MNNNFVFIGFGLIGGSIAKAIKKYLKDSKIYAYMLSKTKLEKAKSQGVVDYILDGIDESISLADIIFLCTPVEYNEEYLEKIKPYIAENTIITDVGSTKTSIHKAVIRLGLEKNFIGGHPMAGSEKTGYDAATPLLLENAYYMLTMGEKVSKEDVGRLESLLKKIKCIPFIIDYKKHDMVVAAISHLPHIVAASLVNLIKDCDYEDEVMKRVAAGGFKDITRIASSSPVIWEQICETNKEPIVAMLNKYIDSLSKIRDELTQNKSGFIYDLFESSKTYRNTLSDRNIGLISSKNAFSVHVVDNPGAVSIIAVILSSHSINIKNIGINHNRELGEGALRIEFYDSDSCELASKLLRAYSYKLDF